MKRIAIGLVGLLIVPLLVGSASAAERGVRRYRAETNDGQVLRFRTVREDTGRRLDALFLGVGFELDCDDGSTKGPAISGFSQWPWYFEGNTVTVNERGHAPRDSWALDVMGTFRPASASGTFRFSEAFVDKDVTSARLCTSGGLTWTADRIGTS